MDRPCLRVAAAVLLVTFVLKCTSPVWSKCRQLECAVRGVARGALFVRSCISDNVAAEDSWLTFSMRGRFYAVI